MKSIMARFILGLILASGSAALADSPELGAIPKERRDGGGLDILAGLSGEYRRLHGHRVHGRGATMIILADDATVLSVDMSTIFAQDPIELGKAVTLAVKPGGELNSFIAARIRPDPPDPSTGKISRRPFDGIHAIVEGLEGRTIRFRTFEGTLLTADATRMPGAAAIRVNDRGGLTYERAKNRQVTALWFEQDEIQPAAAAGRGKMTPATSTAVRRHAYWTWVPSDAGAATGLRESPCGAMRHACLE